MSNNDTNSIRESFWDTAIACFNLIEYVKNYDEEWEIRGGTETERKGRLAERDIKERGNIKTVNRTRIIVGIIGAFFGGLIASMVLFVPGVQMETDSQFMVFINDYPAIFFIACCVIGFVLLTLQSRLLGWRKSTEREEKEWNAQVSESIKVSAIQDEIDSSVINNWTPLKEKVESIVKSSPVGFFSNDYYEGIRALDAYKNILAANEYMQSKTRGGKATAAAIEGFKSSLKLLGALVGVGLVVAGGIHVLARPGNRDMFS